MQKVFLQEKKLVNNKLFLKLYALKLVEQMTKTSKYFGEQQATKTTSKYFDNSSDSESDSEPKSKGFQKFTRLAQEDSTDVEYGKFLTKKFGFLRNQGNSCWADSVLFALFVVCSDWSFNYFFDSEKRIPQEKLHKKLHSYISNKQEIKLFTTTRGLKTFVEEEYFPFHLENQQANEEIKQKFTMLVSLQNELFNIFQFFHNDKTPNFENEYNSLDYKELRKCAGLGNAIRPLNASDQTKNFGKSLLENTREDAGDFLSELLGLFNFYSYNYITLPYSSKSSDISLDKRLDQLWDQRSKNRNIQDISLVEITNSIPTPNLFWDGNEFIKYVDIKNKRFYFVGFIKFEEGHYVVYFRYGDRWFIYNDSHNRYSVPSKDQLKTVSSNKQAIFKSALFLEKPSLF